MMTFLWISAVIIEAIGFARRGDSGAQGFLVCIGFFVVILMIAGAFV